MTRQPLIPIRDAALPLFLGVDVGGTNIKIGLVDNLGSTLAFKSIPTNESGGPQQAVDRAAETCRNLVQNAGASPANVARVGLGAPGTICLKQGKFLEPPNLPHWNHFEIRSAMEKAYGRPVSFINDANAAAYGEFWIGQGRDHESLALFTLGTGVGGGLISDGRLINGVNSFGSECGHFIVDSRSDARLCVWGGGQGHLEAYASASAVSQIANERLAAGASSSLREKFTDHRISTKDVYEAAVQGDEFSIQLIDETAIYLGIGVTLAIHAIDPGLVLLGGAMDFGGANCPVGQRFLKGIVAEFQRRTFPNVFAGTKIEFASLGGDAGYIGAAGIAHQDHRELK